MATTSQVVTASLPSAFETYYTQPSTGLIAQAQKLYGAASPADFAAKYTQPLQAAGLYGAGRIAGLSSEQQAVGQQLGQMQTPYQFQAGTGAMGMGLGSLANLPSMLDQGLMSQYMSPYMQNVVDTQKREAVRDAQKTQLMQNLGAARQGTYGGARQLLAGTERERALGTQLGDIQARGLQAAYEAAQKGLEAERAAKLQQAQTYGTIGQGLGQLGVAQQAADIDRLKTLGAYGDLTRGIQQQQLDTRYQDIMQGINYPTSQLESMSAFLRGIPMTDQTTTTTTPPPSFASQLAGLGLSGLSLYNLLGKTG